MGSEGFHNIQDKIVASVYDLQLITMYKRKFCIESIMKQFHSSYRDNFISW